MKAKMGTIARSVKEHRVFFLFVVGLFTIGIVAATYAVQDNATFSGQTQAGDHDWWTGFNGANQAFCENCHTAIASDIATGPHSSAARSECSFCHSPGGGDHAAAAAACTDCHGTEANDLASATEAHNGIMPSLGESATDASQTCQSCHTHAAVDMTVIADPPIPLQMGG